MLALPRTGVFSRSANWRTADGRYVYARDEVRPPHTLTLALATAIATTMATTIATTTATTSL